MRKLGWILAVTWLLAVGLIVIESPAQQSLPQKADGALQRIEDSAAQAGAKVQEGFEKIRSRVHSMGVETRVYSRLHWDKDLANATFDLTVEHDGIVTLGGKVNDVLAKARAVALAENTVGVTRVIDHLTISTPVAP